MLSCMPLLSSICHFFASHLSSGLFFVLYFTTLLVMLTSFRQHSTRSTLRSSSTASMLLARPLQASWKSSMAPHLVLLASSLPTGRSSRLFSSTALPAMSSKVLSVEETARVQRGITFLNQSPDPYHVVQTVRTHLDRAGFQTLSEDSLWSNRLQAGGKYYFTRHGSSIVAFTIGHKFQVGNGFKILGAHTDSPNLKLKPKSRRGIQSGVIQLNVECYGGGLWHTWFDRDLSFAGRVVVKSKTHPDQFETRLVRFTQPLLRIPNLCIHLKSTEERESFKVNKEDHLQPILCQHIEQALTTSSSSAQLPAWQQAQEPLLVQVLAAELQCGAEDIVDFDLSLYDTQEANTSGLFSEFLCSSRLDNLASCFAIMESFVDHATTDLSQDEDVSIVALFDHEEVGSQSAAGAGSTLISDTIDRLHHSFNKLAPNGVEMQQISKARSFIMSVDMAHAIHPNYASKHEKNHSPMMNNGMVIKSNVNQRYATNGVTAFLTRELGRQGKVPMQEFAVRNDCPCGSTIGPTLSTNTGIRAVDVGMPQLSMHSIREMMGGVDLTHAYRLFRYFLKDFRNIDASLKL